LSRLAFITNRPPLVFMRAIKPCTRWRRRTFGCHVRFVAISYLAREIRKVRLYLLFRLPANLQGRLPQNKTRFLSETGFLG
jgi:hypothetical protein